jgi:hypothetical protein
MGDATRASWSGVIIDFFDFFDKQFSVRARIDLPDFNKHGWSRQSQAMTPWF